MPQRELPPYFDSDVWTRLRCVELAAAILGPGADPDSVLARAAELERFARLAELPLGSRVPRPQPAKPPAADRPPASAGAEPPPGTAGTSR